MAPAERRRDRLLLALLAGTVLLLLLASAATGRVSLPLLPALGEIAAGRTTPASIILLELRVPRALLGALVGASLGLAGAAMQGLLRNPLAEPGVVGVSGLAAFGAVVAFYTGLAARFTYALPLGGIAGAFAAVALLYALAGRRGGLLSLVLAGMALNSMAGALTALALNLSPNPYASFEIVFWLMGSLADRSLDMVALAAPPMLLGWLLLARTGSALDALSLGEDAARSLGFDLPRVRLRIIMATALAVGAAVAVTGVIGFVGLVVPHLLRPLVGYRPGRLLLPSALGGAVLVLASDIAIRLLATGPELKLGVLTALLGAPFFFWLVVSLRREEA